MQIRRRVVIMGFIANLIRKINPQKSKNYSTDEKVPTYNIRIGQELFCTNGETVIVFGITTSTITFKYNNSIYERDKGIIGKTLFLSKPTTGPVILSGSEPLKDNNYNEFEPRNLQKNEQQSQQAQREAMLQRENEEKKRQEQLKIQREKERLSRPDKLEELRKEIEERSRQEKIDREREWEEYRKREEQLDLQRQRREEERAKQLKLELQAKEAEKRRKIELRHQLIKEYEILSGGFTNRKTVLYHNVYGKGLFVGFDSSMEYIHLEFQYKEGTVIFAYPDSINNFLFFDKPDKLKIRDEFLENPKNEQEDIEEQNYFRKVCKIADAHLWSARNQEDLMKFGYNDYSDSYDPGISQKHQSAMDNLSQWVDIRRNPYFARIDYEEKEIRYIGKNAIEDLVIDWRDKICNLYYQHSIYIGNSQYNLSLVRDFDIVSGIYCGFADKYSRKGEYGSDDNKNVISDEFLIKIINANRGNKKTHDIIQTIQHNQYEIITYDPSVSILVQGCAGSGKTMIMFHRLSYMIFNNQDLDINNIFIISPTRLLNIEGNELSRTLKVNDTIRMAMNSFDAYIIRKYYIDNDTYNHNKFENVLSNNVLNPDFVKHVYSIDYIQSFKENLLDLILAKKGKWQEIVKIEKEYLINQYNIYCGDGIVLEDLSAACLSSNAFHGAFEELVMAVSRVPKKNAQEKINAIDKQLRENDSTDSTLRAKREVLVNIVDNWKMSDRTIYIENDDVSVDDKIFSDVFGYFNVLGRSNVKNKSILKRFIHLKKGFSSPLSLFCEYKAIVEKIARYEKFVSDTDYDYLSEIMNRLIELIKKDNAIDLNHQYDFEVFLHLVACNLIFGSIYAKQTYIFIDEFQDYAITELDLYRQVYPNAVFNYFGDFKQNINIKGLYRNDIEQTLVNYNWKVFSINENYRNSRQITEYVNDLFGMNMMPIGIDGSVKLLGIDSGTEVHLDESDRIALIVKSLSLHKKISDGIFLVDKEKINYVYKDEDTIKKGFLNVIPISLVKGLEFEQVYVYPEGMTENELYVSYTRALNKLYILSL